MDCVDENTNVRDVLGELIELLALEEIEENIFRGKSQDLGFGNIFGGQVLGQSLSAASRTVPAERTVHSLHAYFLRPGDPKCSIVYLVDCIRDGRSFSTRRVAAIQKGRTIFTMEASFHICEEGFEHYDPAPEISGPDGVISEVEHFRALADRIPDPLRTKLICDKPIEIRPVNPMNPFAPEVKDPDRYVWFRAVFDLPDDPALHRYLLAYASDFGLVTTSLYPHARTFWDPEMQVASLDHAMWFHREFRMDRWLLYVIHSPSASGARGLNIGRIYQDGVLVASTSQEGLIRKKQQPGKN